MAFISPKGQGQTRSGRFTAPPAAGAFGGSDGAMQKLGRPFVPKPFTGSGGLSAGADTMMSMAMGRHNVQQDLDVEEMIDISALSTRKVDKRLSTKQGLKMKKYLHDVDLSDIQQMSDADIKDLYENFQGMLSELDTVASIILPCAPRGDLYSEARKKRKLQKQDEMNVAGNIAGYTGPLSGPANPKDFYKRMSKAYHGEFLNKPSKIKGKP